MWSAVRSSSMGWFMIGGNNATAVAKRAVFSLGIMMGAPMWQVQCSEARELWRERVMGPDGRPVAVLLN